MDEVSSVDQTEKPPALLGSIAPTVSKLDDKMACSCEFGAEAVKHGQVTTCCQMAPCGTKVKNGLLTIHQSFCPECKEIAQENCR